MISNFMKRASIAALLIALFISTSPRVGLGLSAIVCLGTWIACGEAFRATEYAWASLFLIVALIFGALFLAPLPSGYALVLNFLCLALFVSSLVHVTQLLPSEVVPTTRS